MSRSFFNFPQGSGRPPQSTNFELVALLPGGPRRSDVGRWDAVWQRCRVAPSQRESLWSEGRYPVGFASRATGDQVSSLAHRKGQVRSVKHYKQHAYVRFLLA